jgi:hypothetical protein
LEGGVGLAAEHGPNNFADSHRTYTDPLSVGSIENERI